VVGDLARPRKRILATMPRDDRDAIAMLERSHRKLERRLADLAGAARALADGTATRVELFVAREVRDYLQRSAVRHVDDEEQSIFPRLAGEPRASALIAQLQAEHREHDALHAELAELLGRIERPRCPPALAAALVDVADRLRAAYDAHIAREDSELLPALAGWLDPGELETVHAEMRARRPGGEGRDRRRGGGGGGGKKRPR